MMHIINNNKFNIFNLFRLGATFFHAGDNPVTSSSISSEVIKESFSDCNLSSSFFSPSFLFDLLASATFIHHYRPPARAPSMAPATINVVSSS
jgi:hypothetical protein